MSWPDYQKCVQILFALPVLVNDSATPEEWRGYQLTGEHLKQMWSRLSMKYLTLYNFSVYEEPDFDKATILWVAIIVVVLILVVILLAFIVKFSSKTLTVR